MDFVDKKILVTGASRGLGRHICTHFGKTGAVIIAFARSKEKLKSLKNEVEQRGGRLDFYSLSVSDAGAVEKAVTEVIKKYDSIDVLINNAGVIGAKTSFDQYSIEQIDKEIDTNLKGMLYVTRFVSPYMIKKKAGHIFNISSVGGTRGAFIPGAEVYTASKFGVNGFGDSYSKYLIKHNVHLITLCPGAIKTTIWERTPYRHGDEALMRPNEVTEMIQYILLGRNSTFYKRVVFYPVCEADEW